MNIVIVESPAKAKTINKYLGRDFQVLASFGHVRDLPAKDGSVLPDKNFSMDWEINPDSKKQIKAISKALETADKLILATDPDREGEAISWHVVEILRKNKKFKDLPVERVSFNAITPKAIHEAMQTPRKIDMQLVDAYLARRALDYLVGFNLSPILWRKLPGARSAGRVQSVALRLICERELEVEQFQSQEYWSIEAILKSVKNQTFKTRLIALDHQKIEKFSFSNEAEAHLAKSRVEQAEFFVSEIQSKLTKRTPSPPFITSTLQQEAARKLGFSTKKTMTIAQQLYEGITINNTIQGLITYMRTDSHFMAPEALNQSRQVINELFGAPYLPEKIRSFKKKVKNAQEAHEAIRPTDFSLRPKALSSLTSEQKKLYDLIWKRALASQMADAKLNKTIIDIQSKTDEITLRANGSVIVFDGFLKLYIEGKDHEEEKDQTLPPLKQNESVKKEEVHSNQHFTQPAPRYSEASLVKTMEELGIGRPSTYASTLSVLQSRNYVHMEKRRFVPEDKGRLVIAFLENFFLNYFEYDFTASLESQLDEISSGQLEWTKLLSDFWIEFKKTIEDVKTLKISEVLDKLNEHLQSYIFPVTEEDQNPRKCPKCETGKLSLKTSRYGAFIGCSNYPDCAYTKPFSNSSKTQQTGSEQDQSPKDISLGKDPETNHEILLKTGRFGPYVELLSDPRKRVSIPKKWLNEEISLGKALKLLSLPKLIGKHPETSENIYANLGRYGSYLQHQKTYANLSNIEELFEIGINHAIELLAQKQKANQKNILKDIGTHPDTNLPIQVLKGRYGPYIKYEKINISLPKSVSIDDIDLKSALELIDKKLKTGSKKAPKPK